MSLSLKLSAPAYLAVRDDLSRQWADSTTDTRGTLDMVKRVNHVGHNLEIAQQLRTFPSR